MKRHMKTVKHQLEVNKLTEEEMPTEIPERSTQIQLILVTDEETEKYPLSPKNLLNKMKFRLKYMKQKRST